MTSTTTAPNHTQTVDTYLSMWNQEDASARAATIASAWAEDGRYVDPLQEARGYDALSQMVAGIHTQFPGHRFRRTSEVDAHHEQLRFGWELVAPDGSVTVAGVDVGTLANDGRLAVIAGFFGPLPELAG